MKWNESNIAESESNAVQSECVSRKPNAEDLHVYIIVVPSHDSQDERPTTLPYQPRTELSNVLLLEKDTRSTCYGSIDVLLS
jgi:hypothetical protein